MSTFYRPHATCQIPNLGRMYEELFGRRGTGFFVEVGAYDGITWSNTAFLASLGWRGVYVEPVQEFAAACALHHAPNDVRVIPVAAGAKNNEMVKLHFGGSLSTVSERYVEVYNKLEWARGNHSGEIRRVPSCTLDLILETTLEGRHGYGGFDLLVVDVEGGEQAVFDGFDIERWQPHVMIVELHQDNPDFDAFPVAKEAKEALRRQILACGYTEFYVDRINTIFRRNPF